MSKEFNNAVSPARRAAFEVLRRIETEGAFAAILLPQYEEDLKAEDRGLCHELTLGVLRYQSLLDALIEYFSGKKITRLDLPVVLALRIGLYQLRFLTKIPARAAVNESVNLVYQARLRSAAGFVNAVLRKSERDKDFNPLAAIQYPLDKLSIETSHPLWLLEKWQMEFGFDAAASLARANNQSPPTAFRITAKNEKAVLAELEKAGAELVESKIAPNAWRVAGANAKVRELTAQGRIYLQDEASQLVAHVCDVSANENFLDVCAAPGSKTTAIAISNFKFQISNSKQLFVAGDFSVPRVRILRETVDKYAKGRVRILQYDAAASLPFADDTFDCVLVDAPCSGTGTIRHNPDIRWHLRAEDVAELAKKQLRILTNAAKTVKKGGRLIYSTCSIEREENEDVIEKFLGENRNFATVKINLPNDILTDKGFARTFPQRDDVDGFFIAHLFKTEASFD